MNLLIAYYSHYVLLHHLLFSGDNQMNIIYHYKSKRYIVLNNDKTIFSAWSWKLCQDYIDDIKR
jgi:hypothetical protein